VDKSSKVKGENNMTIEEQLQEANELAAAARKLIDAEAKKGNEIGVTEAVGRVVASRARAVGSATASRAASREAYFDNLTRDLNEAWVKRCGVRPYA